MRINELFNRVADWEWEHHSHYDRATTTVNKKSVELSFFFRGSTDSRYIEFSVDKSMAQTGRGNALEIMSIVTDAISKYVKEHDLKSFYFTADNGDASRVNLYSAISHKIQKTIPYRLEVDPGDEESDRVEFTFVKRTANDPPDAVHVKPNTPWEPLTKYGSFSQITSSKIAGDTVSVKFNLMSKTTVRIEISWDTINPNNRVAVQKLTSLIKDFMQSQSVPQLGTSIDRIDPKQVNMGGQLLNGLATALNLKMTSVRQFDQLNCLLSPIKPNTPLQSHDSEPATN